ncbi:MAG: hypothetical protein AB2L14_21820 [Candidatus Xenobiia bacterium LiM19]
MIIIFTVNRILGVFDIAAVFVNEALSIVVLIAGEVLQAIVVMNLIMAKVHLLSPDRGFIKQLYHLPFDTAGLTLRGIEDLLQEIALEPLQELIRERVSDGREVSCNPCRALSSPSLYHELLSRQSIGLTESSIDD